MQHEYEVSVQLDDARQVSKSLHYTNDENPGSGAREPAILFMSR